MRYYIPIKGECIDSIYLGVNIDSDKKNKVIKHIQKLNPNIKLFQMRVDENAFRLKAEQL